MKKILLATTLLAGSAGYAAADITWAGSAAAGIAREGEVGAVAAAVAGDPGTAAEIESAQDAFDAADAASTAAQLAFDNDPSADNLAALDDAYDAEYIAWQKLQVATNGTDPTPAYAAVPAGDFKTYSSVNLAVTFSGATDGGLTFGATFDMTAGRSYTLADDDGFVSESGAFGMPKVWVEGSFGKLAISTDEYDFYDDTNAGGDAEYTGTFGSFTTGLIVDVDTNNASAKVGFTTGNLALKANADTYELMNVSAAYTMGAIVITAATDESNNASLKVAYANNGLSASAKYNTNSGSATDAPSIDVAVGYEANGLTVKANADDAGGANGDVKWTATAAYDLGGGLSVVAGTNYTQDVMLGAKMAF